MTQKVAGDIYLIDGQMYSFPRFLAVYLIAGDRLSLVDTAPATSSQTVLAGIRRLGFSPQEVDYIFVTHLHLDHCGGVGHLLQEMPRARVIIHQRSARHLIDPSRIMSAILQAEGEEWLRRDGAMEPVPPERIKTVSGGEGFDLGRGCSLEVLACPGHDPSGLCFLERGSNTLFPGDALGINLEDGVLFTNCPTPGFNLEEALEGLEKLQALQPKRLCLAHFGPTERVKETIERARAQYLLFGRTMEEAFRAGDPDKGMGRLRPLVEKELAALKKSRPGLYDHLMGSLLSVTQRGLWGYWERKAGGGA